ncbi:MAG: ParB/RepB/Spo0J family partition protein [Oscillospiraceae bacterium]|nr:ParB/RepB/Spo0J family partition protein [Oscillospiraceae bacterium]
MNITLQKVKEKRIGEILEVEISRIVPNRNQPRKNFDRDELVSLAKSIAQDGILQPLTVIKSGEGYELVAGERRLRAAKMAGYSSVPCIVVNLNMQQSAVMSIVENMQRQELSFFEQAQAIERLTGEWGMTQEAVARRLGISQSSVANKLRLLRLSDECRAEIIRQGLTERHARALLKLEGDEQRLFMLSKIAERGLNVSKTEQVIESFLSKKAREESIRRRSAVFRDIRLFMNTVNKAVEVMKLAGVEAGTKKTEHDGVIEFTVTIPVGEASVGR